VDGLRTFRRGAWHRDIAGQSRLWTVCAPFVAVPGTGTVPTRGIAQPVSDPVEGTSHFCRGAWHRD